MAVVTSGPALADHGNGKGHAAPQRASDMAAFERDLDDVFAADGLTADQAAQRAAKASRVTRHERATADAAAADLTLARLSLWPILGGKAGYTRLSPLDSVVIPLGPGQAFVIPFLVDNYASNAQVSVNVSDYFLRDPPLIDSAQQALDASRLGEQASVEGVEQLARETYYEWVRAKLQLLVARRQLDQVHSTLEETRSLVDVQRASAADVLRVESQQAQAQQVINRLESAVISREEHLRLLIESDDAQSLTVGEDIRQNVTAAAMAEFDDLATRAGDQRVELKSISSSIRAKEAQKDATRATGFPRLSAFASLDFSDPSPRVFPESDTFKLTWMVGAQVSWVFNDALVASATDRRITAEADQLRADRTHLQQQVRLEVLDAYQAVSLAKTALQTSQQGIEAAEEGYRVRKNLFAAGRASVVEMVDIETELTRARIAVLDAQIDLRIAISRLAHAVGDAPAH